MRVLICPDSFKGSLTAAEAATAIARGVAEVWPEAACQVMPMADGGEGTSAILTQAWGAVWQTTVVASPRGSPVSAGWGWDARHRRAVVDVAAVCGLPLTPPALRQPWQMDTRGVGELLQAVVARGARSVWIGLGGSGTNDAGAGMLHALGLRFLAADGGFLNPTPAELAEAVALDWSGFPAALRQIEWQVLTDVDARLTGAAGATHRFGAQKGVPLDELDALDARLAQIGQLLAPEADSVPGDGAAGGLGFALRTALGASLSSGSARVAEAIGLAEAIMSADWVMTGEGRFDASSDQGKVVGTVRRLAAAAGKPVCVLAGQADAVAVARAAESGVCVRAVVPDIATEAESLTEPASLLAALAAQVCRERGGWQIKRGKPTPWVESTGCRMVLECIDPGGREIAPDDTPLPAAKWRVDR
ncbi:glycerate kinase [Halothiobacillus sp. DCM-1]|uniref:glycerate kinase n=1 Tax=Halothiobacillus sp. DCM-1 TaxID=3112558 RepID=UPI0032457F36